MSGPAHVVSANRLPDAAGYEVWLLCCGFLSFDVGVLLPHRPVDPPVNAVLLRGHGEVVLIDAGAGPVDDLWPAGASVDAALEIAGTDPGDVTCLVFTHLDGDHAGGAFTGRWPDAVSGRFPRTAILDEAVDWWLEREDDNIGGPLIRLLAPDRVPAGAEICPEVRYVSAPGHRPGHAVVLVGDELVHGADLIHHAEHVEHPEWDYTFDFDTKLALETRLSWLHRLEAAGTPVVFSHLAGRGIIAPGRHWVADVQGPSH
jgi:glyoxylase-like metal-dependent hydrolase (beta-lactamase superfamily II)